MVALPGPWALLTAMRDCLCDAITEAGPGREVCFCGILAGGTTVQDYADRGQAWVRLVSSYPSDNFPNPSGALAKCYTPPAWQVEVGILRCAALSDDRGNPPTLARQQYVAEVQIADMDLIRRAIACCVGKDYDYALGTYQPIGPIGGVVGGAWSFIAGEPLG